MESLPENTDKQNGIRAKITDIITNTWPNKKNQSHDKYLQTIKNPNKEIKTKINSDFFPTIDKK